MPKALAAVLIARSAFLGSTGVPLSVVKTRPADSALERSRTKDVRRAKDVRRRCVPVNAAAGYTVVPVSLTISLIPDSGGAIVGATAILQDMTEREPATQ